MKLHGLLSVLLLVPTSTVLASPTSPDLLLRAAHEQSLGAQRQLRIEGSFHYEDLVQFGYPFQLLAFTADGDYVRYDLSGQVYDGVDTSLGGSLDDGDVAALLASGRPVEIDPVVWIAEGVLDLRLPRDFPDGPLTVQIFVVYQGQVVFSNPVTTAPEGAR